MSKKGGQAEIAIEARLQGLEKQLAVLRRYAALTNEGATLLTSEDKLTSAALGSFLMKINDLASSKEMETLISVGKAGGKFLKALIKFAG